MHRLFLFVILALTGCSLVPQYQRPELSMPQTWRGSADLLKDEDARFSYWWRNFGSAELDSLIQAALDANNDLQASLHRVAQARAAVTIASAGLWPAVDLSGAASRSYARQGHAPSNAENAYRGGLSIAYELDLWGRTRALRDAAQSRLDASTFDHGALALIIAADTAQSFAAILTLNDRLHVAHQNLKNASEILSIIQARFDAGRASALDLSQQKAALATAEASIASLEQARDSFQSQLAILTGRPPQDFYFPDATLAALKVPSIAPTQPITLLSRRPDIRRAEAALIASSIDIGIARSAFFPRLTFSLDTLAAASPLSAPAALTTGIASSIAAPLLDGGARHGALDQARARAAELVAVYRGSVLNSLKEIEDALSAIRASERRTLALQTAVTESRTAYQLSRRLYEAGSIDSQALLDTQRDLLRAEDTHVQSRLDMIFNSISLYRALGGGWNEPDAAA